MANRWKSVGGMVRKQISIDQHKEDVGAKEDQSTLRLAALVPESYSSVRNAVVNGCKGLNVKIEWLIFKDLKNGTTTQLEGFNNADVLIVDQTESDNRPFLSFELGLRQNISQKPSIVIWKHVDEESNLRLASSNYTSTPYLEQADGSVVIYHELPEDITLEFYLSDIIQQVIEHQPPKGTKDLRFKEGLKLAQRSDLNRHQRMQELVRLEAMLRTDPSFITAGRLYGLLLCYRDLESWDDMIRVISVAGKHSPATQLPQIQYFVAFALNRRNLKGDRLRALEICEKICKEWGSPDAWGLRGRIFKDKFITSIETGGVKDYNSCEEAIASYREVYKKEENLYGGVNLVTLLFCSERYSERKGEIEAICSNVNAKIAAIGGVSSITNFWDVASFFEINVVGGLFYFANQAAPVMNNLASAPWMIESSMNNVRLIDKIRKQRESMMLGVSVDEAAEAAKSDQQRIEFEFWSEYFLMATRGEITAVRLPTLLQTTGNPRPAHVTVHPHTETKTASIEIVDLQGSHDRKYSITSITSLTNVDAPQDEGSVDKRKIAISVHEGSVFSAFSLFFSSELQRTRFRVLCEEGGYKEKQGQQQKEELTLDWEYEEFDGQPRVLGIGATAKVYAGLISATNEPIAVKEIKTGDGLVGLSDLQEEIRTIKHLQHPNIIRFLGCEQTDGLFRLLMECVPGGSLTDLLYQYGSLLESYQNLIDYSKQILEALNYLHSCDIIHRDVKGDNVLVNMYTGTLKVADFGTSKRMAGLNPRTDTLAGTPWYMAPEVIQSDTHDYGRESDIWSFGCTVWQMANGRPPFVEIRDTNELMEMIGFLHEHAEIPSSWPSELKSLLEACFEANPKKRINAGDLLRHSFFAKASLPPGRTRQSFSVPTLMRTLSVATKESPSLVWSYPDKSSDILEQLVASIESHREEITSLWLDKLAKDSTFTVVEPLTTRQLDELLWLILFLIKQEQSQNVGFASKSLEYDRRVHTLLSLREEGILPDALENEEDCNRVVRELQKMLLLFKPVAGHPHLVTKFLRASSEFFPHYIFAVETAIGKYVSKTVDKLKELVRRKAVKGSKLALLLKSKQFSSNKINTDDETPSMSSVKGEDKGHHAASSSLPALPSNDLLAAALRQLVPTAKKALPPPPPIDPQLVRFLQELGLEAYTDMLGQEAITYAVLISSMEKDDLRDVGLPIGVRCVLWQAVLKARSS